MGKPATIAIALVAGIVAIAAPILVSLDLARRQSLDAELNRTLVYAREVLQRSENTSDQIASGTEKLVVARTGDPCAAEQIALMRDIDMSSRYIQAIGYVSGGLMICSSLGRHEPGLPLGPVDDVTPRGTLVRRNVKLPFAPRMEFIVAELDSYATIIHKSLPIDVLTDEAGVSLANFSPATGQVHTSRGHIKPEWLVAAQQRGEAAFFDGEYLVAVLESKRYPATGAIAAIPAVYLKKQMREFTITLVPIGILAGIAMAAAVLYLARQQLSLPAVMRVALTRNEFFLHYQPIIDLRSRQIVGAEALIRWRRADGVLIRPDLFIPAAEDSGMIHRITERVLHLVAHDAPDFMRRHPHCHIGINLSSLDLQSENTVNLLRDFVRNTGIDPVRIIVEATERGFLNADVARQIVHNIRAIGIQVAIDDFGTGYSSLSYLTTLELDILKIDKTFVDTVDTEAATSHVALHIIEMAKSLKLEIIAEGVETESQAQFLSERGVKYAQGWLFERPMPFQDFARQFETQGPAGVRVETAGAG